VERRGTVRIDGQAVGSRWAAYSLIVGCFLAGASAGAQEPTTPDTAVAQSAQVAPVGGPAPGGGTLRRSDKGLESTSLEDLMLEKGLITLDDWIRIKSEEEQRLNERSVVAEFTGNTRWYERITMYGYGMLRYNNTSNGAFRSYHDASIGDKNSGAQPGLFFRRIRWVITGQVSDHVSFFIQPDLASNISGNTHALSMRDAWGEWNFDKEKEYRLRLGLQRVPCSWDNWQASRQRMAIDRADATNSCAQSERDMGVSFMWSPKVAQQRFKQMLDYMYGPGDYGVFHIQVYNGQGLNAQEANANKHIGARLAWPFELPGGRLLEVGVNAMRGQFVVNHGTAAAGTTLFSFNQSGSTGSRSYRDERLNFYMYYPPQPWGFIAEYTLGRTPERQANGRVDNSSLSGGYLQGHYQWKYSDTGLANIYSRYQEYRGGIKFQTGAPSGKMWEWETGVAWQPDPQWEFTVAYAMSQRNNLFTTDPGSATVPGVQKEQYANLIRFQAIWFWN